MLHDTPVREFNEPGPLKTPVMPERVDVDRGVQRVISTAMIAPMIRIARAGFPSFGIGA
jgi:hypothetical protein